MFRKTLFNQNITPACEYCTHSRPAGDGKMFLCLRAGRVSPYYKCRKFSYAPLRRVPKRLPKLPTFTPDDFKL